MKLYVLIIFLLLIPLASAQGHMKLLAVKESQDGYEGSIADLYLDIKPGSGRVFLDTFPLSKLDTQMSTRFAKEIACDYLNIDCNNYDFFYTIEADSPIIGGPSAGASITVLTISVLEKTEINEEVVVSGTINSGGLVGPVGGLKEKINAASENNIKKVLIPKGERFVKDETATKKTIMIIPENIYNTTDENITIIDEEFNKTNRTIDLFEYGQKLGLEIKEVSTINDLMYEFIGKKPQQEEKELKINEDYKETMKMLSLELCNRSERLRKEIKEFTNETKKIVDDADNLTEKGDLAFKYKKYYSSASYCFGANVKLANAIFLSKNMTKNEIISKIKQAENLSDNLNKKIESGEIKTITDLETKIIVKERLIEAEYYLNLTLSDNNTQEAVSNLAYGIERIYSAYSWYSFFDNRGKTFDINIENLRESCRNKLAEAEERYQYVGIYLPTTLENTRREIDNAYDDLNNGDYDLCLFKASKAKAEVGVILSVMGLDEKQVDEILNQKIDAAEMVIANQADEDIFPILGYSYFEYAKDLKESDKYSAFLYAEYALEISNLDMYFKEKRKIITRELDKKSIIILLIGIIIGFLLAQTKRKVKTRAEHRKRKRL